MTKKRDTLLPFSCDSCLSCFGSIKELTEHYKNEHPEMIEKVTMPN